MTNQLLWQDQLVSNPSQQVSHPPMTNEQMTNERVIGQLGKRQRVGSFDVGYDGGFEEVFEGGFEGSFEAGPGPRQRNLVPMGRAYSQGSALEELPPPSPYSLTRSG